MNPTRFCRVYSKKSLSLVPVVKKVVIMVNISPKLLSYFKGYCSSAEVILLFVYMKCHFFLSYRDLEKMMRMRGARVDHSTLQRWVIKFVPLIDEAVRKRKRLVSGSWRMDETYVKLNGKSIYLYRAVDRYSNIVDFFLSDHKDKSEGLSFFRKAITENNIPEKVIIDKSGSNKAALDAINTELDQDHTIQIFQNKYLNNRIEQDHRFVKKQLKPTFSFKWFKAEAITIAKIENIRMIQKRQVIRAKNHLSTFENFVMLIAG